MAARLLLALPTTAFVVTPVTSAAAPAASRAHATLGLFDAFMESPEKKAAREAAKEAEFQAQQEMLRMRRNPELMREYEAKVAARRAETMAQGAELQQLQKADDGTDKLAEWQRLREEGKLQKSDDMVREAGDRSLGGEGLIAERIDTKLPYVDSGYVDESQPDVMEGLKKGFDQLKKGFDQLGGGDKQ